MKNDPRQKLIITQELAPGDALVLTAAIRDLHLAYPGQFVTDVKTACPDIWNYNPYIEAVNKTKKDVKWIKAEYTEILKDVQESYLTGRYHFITAFHILLQKELGLSIPLTTIKGEVFLNAEESSCTLSIVKNLKQNTSVWLINAGGKRDYTNKIWEHTRFQSIVKALPDITFMQIGRGKHLHKPLEGKNVINLIDKTSVRELIQLMHKANGVITGVSFPMHLAAALPGEDLKPCIVIAGARENKNWEAYPWHYYISRDNMLFCCKKSGCWKSRVERLGDGERHDESICRCPVVTKSGQKIPKCMDMISAEEVINAIKMYEGIY